MTYVNNDVWPIHLEHVKARPEGKKQIYVAHFEHSGKHCKRSLHARRREVALQAAMTLEHSLRGGDYQSTPQKKAIADAVCEFLNAKIAEGISTKTHTKYKRELEEFSAFASENGRGHVQVIDDTLYLDYKMARKTRNLLTHHDAIHEKTLHTALMIVRSFLRWCVRQRLLTTNPVEYIRACKPPLQHHYAPSSDVVNAILAHASDPLRLIIMTLAFTGMRSGELQTLRVGDVDLDCNWICIQTLKAKLTRIRPLRRVPLHPRLRPALEDFLRKHRGRKHDPLFTEPTGGLINQRSLNLRLQSIAVDLGFPASRKQDGIVIHSLRHFFETVTINAGIPQRVVDAWLGHTGDQSMGSVYYRLSDLDSQKMMSRVPFL